MTAIVKPVFDTVGRSPVGGEEPLADQGTELELVREGLGISALIGGTLVADSSEGWVISQIPRAVNCVGSSNVERVAVGGNPKQDL